MFLQGVEVGFVIEHLLCCHVKYIFCLYDDFWKHFKRYVVDHSKQTEVSLKCVKSRKCYTVANCSIAGTENSTYWVAGPYTKTTNTMMLDFSFTQSCSQKYLQLIDLALCMDFRNTYSFEFLFFWKSFFCPFWTKGHKAFLSGHRCPCFGLLVTSSLDSFESYNILLRLTSCSNKFVVLYHAESRYLTSLALEQKMHRSAL